MCGIAGTNNKEKLNKMLKQIEHRGDQNSILNRVSDSYWLGINRLVINDFSNDNRNPYTFKGRTIVLNGEIYNYKELAEQLKQKGWNIETGCDAEVALKSYLYWGARSFEMFEGMFSLAIYNKGTIILARDIMGQKPLYIQNDSTGFNFASEAKCLVNSNTVLKSHGIYEAMEHVIGPNTLYSNVFEFPKACYAIIDLQKPEIHAVKYWSFKPRHIFEKTRKEEFREILQKACKMVIPDQVSWGLYLSKGVDSNLLYSYLGNPEYISTIQLRDNDFNKKDFEKNIENIVKHLDFPVGSFSSYGLYLLSKEASKRGHKVVISGEGADEVFAGYMRYLPVASRYYLDKAYPSYKELFTKSNNDGYMHTYAKTISRGYKYEYYVEIVRPYFRNYDPITAMQLFDIDYILPSLLQMGDRMAMMNRVENRCPYLFKDIIEFGLSLSPESKISSTQTKLLNRDMLFSPNVEREKKGLSIPYNTWYEVKGWDRSHYFNKLNAIWTKQNSHLLSSHILV